MKPGERLIEYWEEQPIAVRPAVDEVTLREFEERYRVTLPPDIREYYKLADGFDQTFDLESKKYYCDENGFNFYPLSKVAPVPKFDSAIPLFTHCDSYYVFADYLDWSWGYAVRLDTKAASTVVMIGRETGEPKVVADSFSEFVHLYIEDDKAIYGG